VLDSLRRSDERCIQNGFVVDLSRNVFRFVNDSIDGRAIYPFGLFSKLLEHLLQPLNTDHWRSA